MQLIKRGREKEEGEQERQIITVNKVINGIINTILYFNRITKIFNPKQAEKEGKYHKEQMGRHDK